MTEVERRAALDAIAAEVAVCRGCRLHQGRTKAVPGEGTEATEVMFVGEGPGQNEDLQGRPFVGRAGDLLVRLLASTSWRRDEVFITNVVKCRPPGNRDPEPDEIAACAPFLARQIAALDPALIVTLGRFSMARFRPGARISQVHGTFVPADVSSGAAGTLTFSMYHPAAALRQTSLEATMFADMSGVPAALTESRAQRAARPKTEPVPAVMAESEPAPQVAALVPAPETEPAATAPLLIPEAEPEAPEHKATEPPVVARDIAPLLEAATPELAPVTRPAEAAAPSGGADDNEESNPAAQLSLF